MKKKILLKECSTISKTNRGTTKPQNLWIFSRILGLTNHRKISFANSRSSGKWAEVLIPNLLLISLKDSRKILNTSLPSPDTTITKEKSSTKCTSNISARQEGNTNWPTNKNNNNLRESSIVCLITDTYPYIIFAILFNTFGTLGNIVGFFGNTFAFLQSESFFIILLVWYKSIVDYGLSYIIIKINISLFVWAFYNQTCSMSNPQL